MADPPKDDRGPRPRYKWRLARADTPNHFAGYDGQAKIGLIHAHHTRPWRWYMTYGTDLKKPETMTTNGLADSPREAAALVEDAYDALVAACGRCEYDDKAAERRAANR